MWRRDLLDNTRTKTNLSIREDKLKGIYIADVTEEYVASHEELLAVGLLALHILIFFSHSRSSLYYV